MGLQQIIQFPDSPTPTAASLNLSPLPYSERLIIHSLFSRFLTLRKKNQAAARKVLEFVSVSLSWFGV
jgi:hypothetical protein